MKSRDIRHCRYLRDGICVLEGPMKFSRMHAVDENIVLNFIEYRVRAVVVDGTTQIIDMEIW